jgi:membrane protein required for colicin V production
VQGYDLIMLIVLGMATIFGAIKGFAWQVASLASIIVSYVVAYRFRFDVAEMIQAKPPWNQFLAMLILYVGTSFVIWVAFRLLSTSIDRVRLKEFDRHLGAAFGLAKGMVYCLLITMFATSLLGPKQQEAICHSRSGYYIAMALDKGVGILPKEIHDVVGPYLAQLDDKLKNGGAINGDAIKGDAGVNLETAGSIWPTGGVPGLEGFPTGMQNEIQNGIQNTIQNGIQNGLRNALPQMLPGFESGGTNSAAPANWNLDGGVPSFDAGSIFPPAGGQLPNSGPQIFPPLGQTDGIPQLPGSTPPATGYGNGLRPSGATQPQQAQQPAYVLPRY